MRAGKRSRVVTGITDALTGNEEPLGMIDSHDRIYLLGLRLGTEVLDRIAQRRFGMQRAQERDKVRVALFTDEGWNFAYPGDGDEA